MRETSRDDLILPFQIEGMDVRGRVVRLGPAVDTVLKQHDYPGPVSQLLGEALVLAAMLGSALKFEGTFTLQTKGDGPVRLLVADYVSPGEVRGYASFDRDAVAAGESAQYSIPHLLGEGYLAMTIDQGPDTERYQGIVALTGDTLVDCAEAYFRQSEQIATTIRLAVGRIVLREPGGESQERWRAGGIMVQHLPDAGVAMRAERRWDDAAWDESGDDSGGGQERDSWNRARLLLETVEADELTDPTISPERLLYRLYHEDGVRAFSPRDIAFGCRCSRERVEAVLLQYPRETLEEMVEEDSDRIVARCQFCDSEYAFEVDALAPPGGAARQ
jgi:molecular chaperone Hsp33